MPNSQIPPKTMERYHRLVALAFDKGAADNERKVALTKINKIEEQYPSIRVTYSEWLNAQSQSSHTHHSTGPDPMPSPKSVLDDLADAFSPHLGTLRNRAVNLATAAVVDGIENLFNDFGGRLAYAGTSGDEGDEEEDDEMSEALEDLTALCDEVSVATPDEALDALYRSYSDEDEALEALAEQVLNQVTVIPVSGLGAGGMGAEVRVKVRDLMPYLACAADAELAHAAYCDLLGVLLRGIATE